MPPNSDEPPTPGKQKGARHTMTGAVCTSARHGRASWPALSRLMGQTPMQLRKDSCWACRKPIVWVLDTTADTDGAYAVDMHPTPFVVGTTDAIVVRRTRAGIVVEDAHRARPVPTAAHQLHPCTRARRWPEPQRVGDMQGVWTRG